MDLNLKYLIPNYYVSEMRRPIKANEVEADIKIIAEFSGNSRNFFQGVLQQA